MGEITMAQALNRAIDEAMAENSGVFCLGEDVAAKQGGGVFKITAGLTEKYGENRIRATPISETAIVGAAVGAALAGQRPIAEIMLMNFVGVCMDQIVNHAAKLRFMSGGQTNVPLVIRTTTGVGVGFGGQHSDMLEAWFAHVAGLHVVTPSNAADAQGLMRSSIDCNDPVIFIENILCYGLKSQDPGPGYRVPLGKAAVAREGSDVSVITYGRTVLDALAVASELANEGISVEVIDLRSIAPYDEATVLASVRKTGRALTLHEAVRPFGTGAEIAANIQEKCWDSLKGPVRRIGGTFSPVPFASVLEQAWIPNKQQIVDQIKASMGRG
ncbi:MAG: alpha-ketoacid dehydrogenase subunit beta [Sphingomonadales bacterium]|jgi:pyruvate/2-oxoglutarate/acetoin dehydrogenase E1 component|nr:alpha-ketoacid dehydrogenase subunit beta [Sphingomonadales bacterium]MBK6490679.1 alpha-ketoacid dehydrogenase subunit beta [Sphingomonadales bacterium]MBK8859420.1 alpha-ketoacid dehydrogenase subunit beta [Sphingomonadales bacterium]MBK9589641.1 alpha-ketoacid dehydrogenase subunit beta [Sphingomonadales bacterium]